jgi:uncharacterized protein (TIGR03083 family)
MMDLMGRKGVLQSPETILVADLFPEILDCLLALLSGMSREEWQRPTACAGWNVKDVALHLLGVEVGNLSVRRDGYIATQEIRDCRELVEFIDTWNQDWVRVTRRMSTRLLVETLRFVGEQVCGHFQLLNPHLIGGPVSWAGPDPAPVWLDLAREYTERWHHQQHIRDAVDRPGLKEPKYFAPVLGTFVWGLPHAYRSVDAEDGITLTLMIEGDSGGSWSIRREAESWRLYAGRADRPDAAVRIDEDVAWRLFTRGMDWKAAEDSVTFSGDRQLADGISNVISIIA